MLDHSLAYKILADLVLCREIGEPRISSKNPIGHGARGRRRICNRSVGGRNDGGKLCAIEQIVRNYHGVKILVEGQIELDRIARHERVPLGASSAEENLQTLEARHLVQGGASTSKTATLGSHELLLLVVGAPATAAWATAACVPPPAVAVAARVLLIKGLSDNALT